MPEDAQKADLNNAGWFTTTHWSVVLLAGRGATPGADSALERLCRTYWYPLYAYTRWRGYSPEDGEDLTREFFARLFQNRDCVRAQVAQTVASPADLEDEMRHLFSVLAG